MGAIFKLSAILCVFAPLREKFLKNSLGETVIKPFRQLLFLTLFAALFSAPLSAQYASRMESLLNEPELSWGKAAAFALEASDRLVYSGEADAFAFAANQKWLPKKALAADTVRLNDAALLLMRSFDLKGGIFYSVGKSPHHAYRELVRKKVIIGRTDPHMIVSGEEYLYMIGRILSIKENAAETEAQKRQAREAARKQSEQAALAKEINAQLAAANVSDASATVTSEGVMISLSNIRFLANSATLADSEKKKLDEIAAILKTIPEKRIQVAGHTALAGPPEEQKRTSLARAQAVANYLISAGARKSGEITVQGFGAERPIAGNDTAAGMEANRRVEITILEN